MTNENAPIKAVSIRWMRRPERFWVRWIDHGIGFTGYRIGPFYVGVERGRGSFPMPDRCETCGVLGWHRCMGPAGVRDTSCADEEDDTDDR